MGEGGSRDGEKVVNKEVVRAPTGSVTNIVSFTSK